MTEVEYDSLIKGIFDYTNKLSRMKHGYKLK
jgi:hypothetical protein